MTNTSIKNEATKGAIIASVIIEAITFGVAYHLDVFKLTSFYIGLGIGAGSVGVLASVATIGYGAYSVGFWNTIDEVDEKTSLVNENYELNFTIQ